MRVTLQRILRRQPIALHETPRSRFVTQRLPRLARSARNDKNGRGALSFLMFALATHLLVILNEVKDLSQELGCHHERRSARDLLFLPTPCVAPDLSPETFLLSAAPSRL